MEELKILIDTVKDLPGTVLWILGGFLAYKLFIVGSITGAIYGAIKLAITKLHDWKVNGMNKENCTTQVGRLTISGEMSHLLRQLERIVGINVGISTTYIHCSDIDWLEEAIDEKIEREKGGRKDEE